jgi:hypothetical protein
MRSFLRLLPGLFGFAMLAGVSVLFGIMSVTDIAAGPSLGLAQWVLGLLEACAVSALAAVAVLAYSVYRVVHPAEPVSYDWVD